MQQPKSQRIAIIGLPGSGKSTFASNLGEILCIPVHHLDRHMFEPGGKKRDKQEFIEIQKAMLNEEAWVVEGCSFSTFEMRFATANVLIYFHFSRLVCFWRNPGSGVFPVRHFQIPAWGQAGSTKHWTAVRRAPPESCSETEVIAV